MSIFKRKQLSLGLASVWALGCSGIVGTLTATEVGRVPISAPGTYTIEAEVTANPLALWTDLDVEWEGSAGLSYEITVSQNGQRLSQGSCDPMDVNLTMNATSTDMGSRHTRSHQGLLHCSVSPPVEGLVEVSVTLTIEGAPTIHSADVYLKQ